MDPNNPANPDPNTPPVVPPVTNPDPAPPAPQITLETINNKTADQLDDNDKKWLEDNKSTLDDATAEKFGISKEIVVSLDPPVSIPAADDEDEDLKNMDPEQRALLEKIAAKQTKPLYEKSQLQEVTSTVETFLQQQQTKYGEDMSKYREAIVKHKMTAGYSQVPIANIFKMVAGDDLVSLGARLERQAATKAKETVVDASTARVEPGKKDWSKASAEEIAAEKARVLGRPA